MTPFLLIGSTQNTFTVWEALAQIAAVALLSVFAFLTMRVAGILRSMSAYAGRVAEAGETTFAEPLPPAVVRALFLLTALMPTILYSLHMKDEYVPAVFAMALVAIIVAADHDVSLENTQEVLHHELEHLRTSTTTLQKEVLGQKRTAERILGYSERHTWFNVFLDKFTQEPKHQKEIRTTCVVRHWEVSRDFPNRLGDYSKEPMYEAFFKIVAANAEIGDPKKWWWARFLTDAPVRVQVWSDPTGQDIRYLYGLLSTLVLIYEAYFSNPGAKVLPARIRVGRAPIWVHVIDDEVHQMIESRDYARALSRPLSEDVNPGRLTKHQLAAAYRNTILRAYDRGARAEAYVASILLATEYPPSGYKSLSAKPEWGITDTNLQQSNGFEVGALDHLELAGQILGSNSSGYKFKLLQDTIAAFDDEDVNAAGNQKSQKPVFDVAGIKDANINFSKVLERYLCLRWAFINMRQNPSRWTSLDDALTRASESLKKEDALRNFLLEETWK